MAIVGLTNIGIGDRVRGMVAIELTPEEQARKRRRYTLAQAHEAFRAQLERQARQGDAKAKKRARQALYDQQYQRKTMT
jgi:hypothetical protein